MQTQRIYFDDSYQFTHTATITSCSQDENGPYILLDSTIFHPQGGGQPADQGTITVDGIGYAVCQVKALQEEVRHYISGDCPNNMTGQALLQIDRERRVLHARLHTAGHVISIAVEAIYPDLQAVKGHHYPEGPYVEFTCRDGNRAVVDLERINREIAKIIAQEHQVVANMATNMVTNTGTSSAAATKPLRLVSIGDVAHHPCGGTHVKNLNELKGLVATKQKFKDSRLRISYSCT